MFNMIKNEQLSNNTLIMTHEMDVNKHVSVHVLLLTATTEDNTDTSYNLIFYCRVFLHSYNSFKDHSGHKHTQSLTDTHTIIHIWTDRLSIFLTIS